MTHFDDIRRQLRRAIVLASVLAGCIGLLQLAGPVLALAVVEGVLPSGDLELLRALLIAAALAGGVAAVLVAAERRLLLRASLWMEHAVRATPGADATLAARADTVGACLRGTVPAALLAAPSALLNLAAATLLAPRLALAGALVTAAVLACAAGALLASHAALRSIDDHAGTGHGTRLAACYRACGRTDIAAAIGLTIAVAGVALVGALASALVLRGSLSIGAALAATMLIAHAALTALRVVEAAPAAFAAVLAWRRIAAMAALVQAKPGAPEPSRPITADAVHRIHFSAGGANPLADPLALPAH